MPTEAAWRQRFRAPRINLPTWAREAPDRLLYSTNATGKWELYAWDRASDTHRQFTDRPEGTLQGRIDPTGEWLWWFDDAKGDELGHWRRQPFAGGRDEVVAPALPPAYAAGLALGRDVAVVGAARDDDNAIYLVRAADAPTLLYRHRESASVAGLSTDDTLLCLSHAEHGDSRHPALRVLTLDGAIVADLWDGPDRGLHAAGWSRAPGDQRLLVIHERGDSPRPLLWEPLTGRVVEVALDLPGEVSASWYPAGDALLLSHDHRGRTELYRYDLDARTLTRLESEPGTVMGAAVRPDGALWYAWSRSSAPPLIRAGADVLLRPAGAPAPAGVAYQALTVGDIPIFVAEPVGARPHPTLLWIHGGPTAHDRDSWSPLVQAWVEHGYAVALVNYRGSTGNGRAWRDAITGNPGLTELADIVAVRDWLVAEGVADPARLALGGGSWGGYLTLLGLGVYPDRWALGVAAVPVADYVAAYEDEMEPLKAFDRALFGGAPADLPDAYRERSPITYVEQVRAPVLILAGEHDPRCPIRQIDNYLARLNELGKPHAVYRFDAGHGSLVIDEAIRQVEIPLAFAAQHLGTPPPW